MTARIDVSVVVRGSPADPEADGVRREVTAALDGAGLSHEVLFTGSPRDPGRALVQVTRAARGDAVVWTDPTQPAGVLPELVLSLVAADAAVAVPGPGSPGERLAARLRRRAVELLVGARIPRLGERLLAVRRDKVLRYLHLLPHRRPGEAMLTTTLLSRGHTVEFLPLLRTASGRPPGGGWRELVRLAVLVNPVRSLLSCAAVVLLLGIPSMVAGGLRGATALPILGALQLVCAGLMAEGAIAVTT
ncbi:MAG: hypothetical protein HY658_03305, partial [Actinobacteria bacterium]|nr:hypothetical protein [Actinomycetota bacterium]